MKRPFASSRPIGPFAQLSNRSSDTFVVRFTFHKSEGMGLGEPFDFEEDDPDGVIEDDLKDAIRDVFTTSELQYVDTVDNELIYEPGGMVENKQFGRSATLWSSRSTSELDQVQQNVDDVPGISTPELTFVTVSDVR